MPIARFEMPDGRIGRFEVPEGTTPEQANALIRAQISQTPAQVIKEKSTNLAQDLWQGAFKDPATAIAQIGANIANYDNPEGRKVINESVASDDPGFSAGRMVGSFINPVNAGAGLVLNGVSKGGKVVSALKAAGVSAPAGMLSSPVIEGDFVEGKIGQGVAGAVGGAIGQKAGAEFGNILATRQAAQDLQRRANSANILSAINQTLVAEGLPEFNMMPHEVQTNLAGVVRQVQAAMRSGSELDSSALVRKAIADSVIGPDAGLTLGQANRDPLQWSREFNLKGIEGAGQPIAQRLQLQNQRLIDFIRSRGIEDQYNAGTRAINGLQRVDASDKAGVDSLYAQARDHLGRAAPMDAATFSQQANLALDDQMLGHYLPAQVRNTLNDVSTGKIPFNVNTAVQIDQVLSAAQRSAGNGTAESLAISKVRNALNGATIADNVGEDAKKTFDQARSAARSRFARHEEVPALGAVANDNAGAQEAFIRKFVTGAGASADNVSALMQTLPPDSASAIRNAVRYQILQKAASGAETGADTATISQSALKRSLDSVGDQKLSAIFGPEEAARLRNVQYVASLIQKEPFGAVPNRSGTTAALANLLQSRFLSMPGLNIVRDSTKKAINEQEARNALQAIIQPTAPTPNTQDANRLRAIAQTIGIPLGGAAGVQATK